MFQSRSPRYRVRFDAVFDDGETYMTGPVTNLSESGLFLETAMPLPAGRSVRIIPVSEEDVGLLELHGEVVRVEKRGRDEAFGMGVKLKDLRPEDKDSLRRFCEERLGEKTPSEERKGELAREVDPSADTEISLRPRNTPVDPLTASEEDRTVTERVEPARDLPLLSGEDFEAVSEDEERALERALVDEHSGPAPAPVAVEASGLDDDEDTVRQNLAEQVLALADAVATRPEVEVAPAAPRAPALDDELTPPTLDTTPSFVERVPTPASVSRLRRRVSKLVDKQEPKVTTWTERPGDGTRAEARLPRALVVGLGVAGLVLLAFLGGRVTALGRDVAALESTLWERDAALSDALVSHAGSLHRIAADQQAIEDAVRALEQDLGRLAAPSGAGPSLSLDVEARPLYPAGGGLAGLHVALSVDNPSAGDVEVVFSRVRLFAGDLLDAPQGLAVSAMNPPEDEGPVRWRALSSSSSVAYDDKLAALGLDAKEKKALVDARAADPGLTGALAPGAARRAEAAFAVPAAGQLYGVVVDVGLLAPDGSGERRSISRVLPVPLEAFRR